MKRVRVCFIVFGTEKDYRIEEAVKEAVDFFRRSKVRLEWIYNEVVIDIEPSYWEELDCYFAHKGDYEIVEDMIPYGYDIYVMLWRAKSKPVCWAGGTWGGIWGIKGGWLCSLPYDLPDSFDEVKGQWKYRLSQRIVHELLNALNGMGIVEKSPEKCVDYGYEDELGGWKKCYEDIIGKRRSKIMLWLDGFFARFMRWFRWR